MSRNPGYPRAGANGGYANGNGSYSNGGYGGYPADDNAYDERPSSERSRRPGGYGGMGAPDDDYRPRPSNERARRPGGYGGRGPEDDTASRLSADRERGPAGYGGLSGGQDEPRRVTRPISLERSQAKRRSRDDKSRSRPRNDANYGQGSQAIEEVLQSIHQNWDFMTKDQCVPIEVALKLMDSSSLGLAGQAAQFRQTHDQLQNALKGIVNGMTRLDRAASVYT
jgi:exocyst complex component 4